MKENWFPPVGTQFSFLANLVNALSCIAASLKLERKNTTGRGRRSQTKKTTPEEEEEEACGVGRESMADEIAWADDEDRAVSSSLCHWFIANVEPFLDDVTFEYVVAGNELVPNDLANFILPTMHVFLIAKTLLFLLEYKFVESQTKSKKKKKSSKTI